MDPLYPLLPLNVMLIALYMRARLRDDKAAVRIVQPAAVGVSWLIAASSLLLPAADVPLIGVVLAGMGIALVGDFLNIDMEAMRVVLRGLAIAVVAYLTYAIGWTALDGFHAWDLPVAAALVVVYAGGELAIALATRFGAA